MFFYFGPGGGSFIGFLMILFLARVLFKTLGGSDASSTHSYSHTYSSYNPGYIGNDKAFFVGAFSMLAKLAKADGEVSESAKRKINEFMIYDLKLDNKAYSYATGVFNDALNQNISFENLVSSFYQQFSGSQQVLQLMIDIFYRIAMSDGRISSKEQSMIDFAARTFRISETIIDSIKRKYGFSSSSNKAYAVLGLTETASDEEIKKTYRKLILDFHPDTIASKGLADEFKQYATKRFREIQEAYESICKERNIK